MWKFVFRSKENIVGTINPNITMQFGLRMSAAFAQIEWLHLVAQPMEHFVHLSAYKYHIVGVASENAAMASFQIA